MYLSWLIQGFQRVIDDCDLKDMELHGYPFTWKRGRGTDLWIKIRLDRALVTSSWSEIFQTTKLANLEVTTSDHCPIFLVPEVERMAINSKRFRLENAWLCEPMCQKIVEKAWETHRTESLQDKLKSCSKTLAERGHEVTGSFRKRIASSKKVLKLVRGRRDDVAMKQFETESKKLMETLTQQEVFWKQRSKQL